MRVSISSLNINWISGKLTLVEDETIRGVKIVEETDLTNEKEYYIIDPEQLLQKEKWNQEVKMWLHEQVKDGTAIEAYMFASEFYQSCQEIQNELWAMQTQQIHDDLSTMFAILPTGFSNVYNVSVLSENQTVHIGIGQIIAQFLKKAAYQYPKFIPDSYMGRF